MNYKNALALFALAFFLSGCISSPKVEPMIANDKQLLFTYDFKVTSTDKNLLWKRARDYFASSYGDFRSVFTVMDEEDGTLIGKAITHWNLYTSAGSYSQTFQCSLNYHIRFIAKDNKARLQLEIIDGAPITSSCGGWKLPTEKGYKEVVDSFNLNAKSVEKALNGKGAFNDFKKL